MILPRLNIQGRFAVWDERYVFDFFSCLGTFHNFSFNIRKDLINRVEFLTFKVHVCSYTNLAINTGKRTVFGWNMIDAQAVAQTARRDRAKRDHSISL
jgi:hypothetical protein